MKSTKDHLAPNVIPGTNFSVDRFQELYAWIEACRADSIAFNLPSYGLLCNELNNSVFDLQLNGKAIGLNHCLAITKSGILVAVLPEQSMQLQINIDEPLLATNLQLDILLIADLKGKRIPVGQPNSNEIPLRPPFAILPYRIELQVPGNLVENGDYLKIGELISNNSSPILSNYLPACAQAGAHAFLWSQISKSQAQLKDFYQALKSIIKNIDSAKEGAVVVSFAKLCKEIGGFLAMYVPRLSTINSSSDPNEFFEIMRSFAERIDFEWQINARHTELLELVHYNVRNSTTDFEYGIVEDLARHIPSPYETNKTLHLIEQFMNAFVLPIISISAQSRIMRKQEKTVWKEKENTDRNAW